jgi:hypothetical protein
MLPWIGVGLSVLGLALAGYEIWADIESERIILAQIKAAHGEQALPRQQESDAWRALLSGQRIDARALGIGGL